MLQHISTGAFIEDIVLATTSYYMVIAAMFYPKEIWNWLHRRMRKQSDNTGKDQFYKDKV